MSDSWKQYWPVYKRFESEFCELTFYIALEDAHLNVYSTRMVEMLLKICAECENVAKELLREYGFSGSLHLKFPGLGEQIKQYSDLRNLGNLRVQIVWPYHSLNNLCISPLVGWDQQNPDWYKNYNNIKHNRTTKDGLKSANYKSVLYSLSALYLLNSHLVMRCNGIDELGSWRGGRMVGETDLFSFLNQGASP
jgi:hypothetical protein